MFHETTNVKIVSFNVHRVQLSFCTATQCIPVCHQWSRHGTLNRSWTQWSVSWSQRSPARNM